MTFEELLRELGDGNPTTTAQAMLRRMKVPKDAIEVFLPAVIHYVQISRRATARTNERIAMTEGGPTSAHARTLLTANTFAIGDGKFVTWGQATVEQHEMRISALIAHRNGVDETIERHRAAIAVIQQAGVFCLDQVEDVA